MGKKMKASISADGQKDISVPFGKSITINKKKDKLKLIHPKSYNFLKKLVERNWDGQLGLIKIKSSV